MSLHYFAGCDQCRERVPLWRSGSPSIATDPDAFRRFLEEHLSHGIVVFREDDAKAAYRWKDGDSGE